MNALLGLPALATFIAIAAVPFLWLDGGRGYLDLLWRLPGLVSAVALAWAWIGYWCTRRVAEVILLRRSGAKLRMDA
jgi:hypothetical protein